MINNSSAVKKKIFKYLLTGSFYFFLIKGIIWLIIIVGAFFGLNKNLVKNMFVAMNRFKIVKGREKDFENVWRNRDTF